MRDIGSMDVNNLVYQRCWDHKTSKDKVLFVAANA